METSITRENIFGYKIKVKHKREKSRMWRVNVSHSAHTQITKYFLQQINEISPVRWDS